MSIAITKLIRIALLVAAMPMLAPPSLAREPVAVAMPDVLATRDILASPESRDAWRYKFSAADEALLDEIQRGCFQYFWNEVGSGACLAKDKTSDTVCSIAAVGFQLSSLPIGV